MDLQVYLASLRQDAPPTYLTKTLLALWYDGKGNWQKAHDIAQDIPNRDGAWIHAYLHRKEGDIWNASYWYEKANRQLPASSLEEEWLSLTKYFLSVK